MPAPDAQVASVMERLSDLQTWCALMARKDSGGMAAFDLIQETRALIADRLYTQAIESTGIQEEEG